MATTWSAKAKKRKRPAQKSMLEQIRVEMRIVQKMTGCATSTINAILRRLHPFLKGCENVQVDELRMREMRAKTESALKRRLHGCIDCNNHVFGPSDNENECPKCAHPRYDEEGKPHEVCSYFF